MKIFLSLTSPDDMRWAATCGFLDGVLVSPALLHHDVTPPSEAALETTHRFGCPVILSLGTRDVEELRRDARDLARSTDQVMMEFPLSLDTVDAIHQATTDGVRVAASMVFTAAQALLAAKAGAAAVLVHVGALEAQGQTAAATLSEMRAIFDVQRLECDLIAVRPSSAGQVAACAVSGADAVVVEISVLRDLLIHPLADKTLDALLQPSTAAVPARAP
jgi:transaldolase